MFGYLKRQHDDDDDDDVKHSGRVGMVLDRSSNVMDPSAFLCCFILCEKLLTDPT
jgi:hypothetical protein